MLSWGKSRTLCLVLSLVLGLALAGPCTPALHVTQHSVETGGGGWSSTLQECLQLGLALHLTQQFDQNVEQTWLDTEFDELVSLLLSHGRKQNVA